MASLKETKNRISSVQNTLKITSAMKMVASAKFHQSQVAAKKVHNYEQSMLMLLNNLMEGRDELDFVFATERPVKRVALVPISSDSGLCGSFNSNVLKMAEEQIEAYQKEGIELILFPVGEKITHSLRQTYPVQEDGRHLVNKPTVEKCKAFTGLLMKGFQAGSYDKVVFLYHHLKTATRQVLSDEVMLPYTPAEKQLSTVKPQERITEPSAAYFLRSLFPQVLCTRIYNAISESLVAEFAARMTAMQIATDNGNDLLRDLTILYNKTRQQTITSQIQDLAGGRIRRE
ncbi:MAG: ATP synthase F1 subunit gamma [Bacteroidota bacterium]|nr:ATP synthase F1 subunit gamma [Bacteroidota bacterium]